MGTALAIGGSMLLGGAASAYGAHESGKAAGRAADKQSAAAMYAADLQQQQFETTREDQLPWMQAGERALGTLEEMMADRPTFEDYQMSDYAQFQRDEGLRAIEAKSRAGGYYNTGATSREMLDYAQDVSGRDYQNYLNQYYQSLNPYMQLSGTGQQQSNIIGQQGAQSAARQGQYAMQGANAQAQGIIGQANARVGLAQNLAGLGMGGMQYLGSMTPQSNTSTYNLPNNWAGQTTTSPSGSFTSTWEK